MSVIAALEARQKRDDRNVFSVGDTVRLSVKVIEGNKEREQPFQGVVVQKANAGVRATFTLRKVTAGVAVERIFPLHSPNISDIQVVRRGSVRRARLYYLRKRSGKAARIRERREETSSK
jgi:large subunit ribosomal protein L19